MPSTLGPKQFYEGALNTVGIDIGVVGTGGLNRAVLAPTAGVHDWQGTYVGASGDTALGAGVALDVTLGLSAPSTAMGGPVSRIGTVETVCVWCGHRQLTPIIATALRLNETRRFYRDQHRST